MPVVASPTHLGVVTSPGRPPARKNLQVPGAGHKQRDGSPSSPTSPTSVGTPSPCSSTNASTFRRSSWSTSTTGKQLLEAASAEARRRSVGGGKLEVKPLVSRSNDPACSGTQSTPLCRRRPVGGQPSEHSAAPASRVSCRATCTDPPSPNRRRAAGGPEASPGRSESAQASRCSRNCTGDVAQSNLVGRNSPSPARSAECLPSARQAGPCPIAEQEHLTPCMELPSTGSDSSGLEEHDEVDVHETDRTESPVREGADLAESALLKSQRLIDMLSDNLQDKQQEAAPIKKSEGLEYHVHSPVLSALGAGKVKVKNGMVQMPVEVLLKLLGQAPVEQLKELRGDEGSSGKVVRPSSPFPRPDPIATSSSQDCDTPKSLGTCSTRYAHSDVSELRSFASRESLQEAASAATAAAEVARGDLGSDIRTRLRQSLCAVVASPPASEVGSPTAQSRAHNCTRTDSTLSSCSIAVNLPASSSGCPSLCASVSILQTVESPKQSPKLDPSESRTRSESTLSTHSVRQSVAASTIAYLTEAMSDMEKPAVSQASLGSCASVASTCSLPDASASRSGYPSARESTATLQTLVASAAEQPVEGAQEAERCPAESPSHGAAPVGIEKAADAASEETARPIPWHVLVHRQ